jgi:thioredoxin-like negative regulator of GroEL
MLTHLVDHRTSGLLPCLMSAPPVEELARESRGKIKAERVTMDKQFFISGRFGIRIIATQLLYKVGQVIATIMRDTPKESCEDLIKRAC